MKIKKLSNLQLANRRSGVIIFSTLLLTGLFAFFFSGNLTSFANVLATPGFGFFSTIVGPARFGDIDVETNFAGIEDHRVKVETNGDSDAYIVSNRVIPGGHSGWHTHPGPSIVSVKSGTATVYSGDDPGCTPQYYTPGTGFVDEGGGHVHMVRNEGSVDLELVAFQIIPAGAPRRIDVTPAPGNCPF